MTTEEEAAAQTAGPDDRSAIAKLMENVQDDAPQLPDEEVETQVSETEQPDGTPQGAAPQPEDAAAQAQAAGTGAPAEDEPQDDYEREIEAIQAPKGASTRTTEVLKILKDKNKKEHRAFKAEQARAEELGKRKLLDDDTEKELGELRRIRDELAIEHSPVFKGYEQDVKRHETDAINLLRQWRLPEETAKYINDNGGLLKFQASDQPMPNGVEVEGKAVSQSQWWAKVIKPALSEAQRDELSDHLFEARRAIRERNSALAAAKNNPQRWLEGQQKKAEESAKEFKEKADKQVALEADLYGELAKEKVLPANATPEQKAEVESHNARLKSAQQDAVRWVNDHSPEAEVSKALARVYRDFAQNRVREVEAEKKALEVKLLDLQKKWDDVKKSRDTTRQQATVQQSQQRAPEYQKYDAASSIRELMEKVPTT